jgi:hypothetical protein
VKEIAMTPGAERILDHWAAAPDFRQITVREAARQLQELVPSYPDPSDHPVAICVNGYRWFGSEMEAVADAIYRTARRPHQLDETLAGPHWDVERDDEGRWSVPGMCLARVHAERASDRLHTA